MKIAILGYGVIGGGVYDLIQRLSDKYDLQVVKVLDRVDRSEQLGEVYTDNFDEILEFHQIDLVVECMGGVNPSYEYIVKCLNKGISVVTSNKEVVALHLKEFYKLAKSHNVYFLFEASVGGGIPIIKAIQENVKVNKITKIYGILNGTTNYILTKMSKERLTFEQALCEAKRNGFAEANPVNDLNGMDGLRKIVILSMLAYDAEISPGCVQPISLSGFTDKMLDEIERTGAVLKYVAQSELVDDQVFITVAPTIIDKDSLFASIEYENNCVAFWGSSNGELDFVGKGAGKYPTATAVVGDVMTVYNKGEKFYRDLEKKYQVTERENLEYYIFDRYQQLTQPISVKDVEEKVFVTIKEAR